jgi:hypothetical protein
MGEECGMISKEDVAEAFLDILRSEEGRAVIFEEAEPA